MVYLIHFDEPFYHANHYIGFAEHDVEARLKTHKSGRGARLLRSLNRANIDYNVVRVWEGADRAFERRLKKRKKASDLCPVCSGNIAYDRGNIKQ